MEYLDWIFPGCKCVEVAGWGGVGGGGGKGG